MDYVLCEQMKIYSYIYVTIMVIQKFGNYLNSL